MQCISWAFSGYRVQSYQDTLVGECYFKYTNRLERETEQTGNVLAPLDSWENSSSSSRLNK